MIRIILESTERSDDDEDDELETSQGFQVIYYSLTLSSQSIINILTVKLPQFSTEALLNMVSKCR